MNVKEELLAEETAFDFLLAPISADITETVLVELVDACNGACVTCVRGLRLMKNKQGQMDFALFEKIIEKIARMGFHWVSLFNWSDPFLCRGLVQYAALVKQKGLSCQLSTNLSYRSIPDLIPILENTEELLVSVSGFHQSTYKINHRSGNVELVKANLKKIGEALKAGLISTNVFVYYFNYPYSIGEWPLFKQFAEDLGINALLWHGEGDPTQPEKMRKLFASQNSLTQTEDIAWTGFTGMPLEQNSPDFNICYSAAYPTIIDSYGDVHLCPRMANTPATRLGNFLEDDFDVLQYRRISHPICARCKVKSPIQISPVHMACLVRGALKQYGYGVQDMSLVERDAAKARELAGKEVIFWGSGEMYKRKCHIFRESRPKCVLSESPASGTIHGVPLLHPDDVLPHADPVPIVIFAGAEGATKIQEKIREKYPQFTDIYVCTENINMWPEKLRQGYSG